MIFASPEELLCSFRATRRALNDITRTKGWKIPPSSKKPSRQDFWVEMFVRDFD
jgi:hypothetical protein